MKTINHGFILKVETPALLLVFLRQALPDIPAGRVKAYLEHRQISVDGVVTTQYNYPLQKGQTVSIQTQSTKGQDTSLEILYEDEFLLAVNKPAGLLSVASDSEKEKTAYRILKTGRQGQLFVVHRLDKDTSGVLLFAKSEEIKQQLQASWDDVRREYLAVCDGVFEQKSGRCETFLKENAIHRVYSGDSSGKRAITNYCVTRENAHYSFVKINIETGRKNQIRVHMSELGHPVIGDKKYGGSKSPFGRLGLHASLLEIIHPVTGAKLVLRAAAGRRFTLPSVPGSKNKTLSPNGNEDSCKK